MYMRRAHLDDLDTIVTWRQQAATWLAATGSDQWSSAGLDDDTFRRRVTQSIAAGETWMAVGDDGSPLGTIALDQWADEGLWSADTLQKSLVIHRMIIDRAMVGHQIGQAMLDHADRHAAAQGMSWLILDAWTTNTRLHQYYQDNGFEHVGTRPEYPSGALFQRPVRTHA